MRVTLLILAAMMSAKAQPIAWDHTTEALKGKFILVKLTSGTLIGGGWLSVTSQTFTMSVESSSNKHEIQKGLQTVARSSIAEVRVRNRRVRGRVIGTLAGFYSVAAIGSLVSGSMEALQGPTGIAALGGAVAGYFIGRSLDKASREIVFIETKPRLTRVGGECSCYSAICDSIASKGYAAP